MTEEPREAVDPYETTYVSVKFMRWALDVLRDEAKRLRLVEKGGRPLKGDAPGTETGSLPGLFERYAREILATNLQKRLEFMEHVQERASGIEHIEATANLLDDEQGAVTVED